jgi:hypothetical protein
MTLITMPNDETALYHIRKIYVVVHKFMSVTVVWEKHLSNGAGI